MANTHPASSVDGARKWKTAHFAGEADCRAVNLDQPAGEISE
jgi:hypothetical protein